MATIKQILVAIDLSEIASTVLDHAQSLARAWGAHVVVPPSRVDQAAPARPPLS